MIYKIEFEEKKRMNFEANKDAKLMVTYLMISCQHVKENFSIVSVFDTFQDDYFD